MAEHIQVVSNPSRPAELGKGWPNLALFLVVGYLGLGKPFAYLGLPWISLYIGEIALLAFLFFGPRTKEGNWLSVSCRVQKLRRLKRLLLLSLVYGGFVALRGSLQGYPALTAARDTAFNYYPLFLFLGIWVGLRDSRFLCRAVRILSLWAGSYGLAYILF